MWLVYGGVAAGALFVAFLVMKAIETSGITKVGASREVDLEELGSDILVDDDLQGVIAERISGYVDSSQKGKQIAKSLSSALTKELAKKVEENKKELQAKFDKLIEQREHSEEIALKKYKKVLNEKKSTEAVIRSIAEGLVVVNAEGKVVMMNPAAEKLLGVEKNQKIGTPIMEGLKDEQLISMAKGPVDQENREIELISQENETKKVLRASSAVIESEDGQTVGMVSMLTDITKQKELDALKSKFVASVSHELRTPLVAIEKSVSLLLSKATGELSPPQEQFLSIAARNLRRLTNLINDLLDMSKLEAGRMRVTFSDASMQEVIAETNEGLKTWADAKAITIKEDIQSNLPQVSMDPQRMIQVLTNLVGNAIKFTPKEGVITVSASVEGEDIRVCVADSGEGIPKGDLPKIFDKFYQASNRATTDISGTGLGLSIAKEVVEIHKGKIWVESDQGEGAKFIFTIPLKRI